MLGRSPWARIDDRRQWAGRGRGGFGSSARRGGCLRLPPSAARIFDQRAPPFCERGRSGRLLESACVNRGDGQVPLRRRDAAAAGSRHRAQIDRRLLAALHGADHGARGGRAIPQFLGDARPPRDRGPGRLRAHLPHLSRDAAGLDEEPEREGAGRGHPLPAGLDAVRSVQLFHLLCLRAARRRQERHQHAEYVGVRDAVALGARRCAQLVFPVRRLGRLLRGDELRQAVARRRPAQRDARPRGAGGAASGAALPDQSALPVQHAQFALLPDPVEEDRHRRADADEPLHLLPRDALRRPDRRRQPRRGDPAPAPLSRHRADPLSRPARRRGRGGRAAARLARAGADPAADRRECGQIWRRQVEEAGHRQDQRL